MTCLDHEDYNHKHAHLTNFPVRAKAIRISGQGVTIAPVHHGRGNHGGGNYGHNHYGGDNHSLNPRGGGNDGHS